MVSNRQTTLITKHIKVRFYYTRDKISDGTIKIEYCPTKKMIANGLTKALTAEQFVRLRDGIMMPKNVDGTSGGSV